MSRPTSFGLLGVLVLACSGCGAQEGDAPRDLVLVTLDTLRADRLGSHGNPRGLTPHLDRLAERGARFSAAFAPITCTGPSHATLFTGLHPLAHGLTDNYHALTDDVETLAETLGARGFTTAAFCNRYDFPTGNLSQGFEFVARDMTPLAEETLASLTDWLAQRDRSRRTFLWVHLYTAHAPVSSPPSERRRWIENAYAGPLDESFQTLDRIRRGVVEAPEEFFAHARDGYDADVAFVDGRLGEVLTLLEDDGLLADAFLCVTSDHGESLERGVTGLHSPVIRDVTLHVPLLFAGPGVPAGWVSDELVALEDVHPTLLEAVGFAPPADASGISLVPALSGAPHAGPGHVFAMLPSSYLGKKKPGGDAGPALCVRTERWKLVRRGEERHELFDVRSDPAEEHDVAAQHPDVVRELSAELDAWALRTHAPSAGGELLSREALDQLRALGYVDED